MIHNVNISFVIVKAIQLVKSLMRCRFWDVIIYGCHTDDFLEINSLWPSDAIWRHRSGSILVQVMACCLTAPSHYLNQCWLIVSKALWHSSEGNFSRDNSAINHLNLFENHSSKIQSKPTRGQWVNSYIDVLVQDCSISRVLDMEISVLHKAINMTGLFI